MAAIHLEDCAVPKHVGRLPERVVPREEMVQKLRAALDARRDPNFTIIARTDAKAVHGLAEAVERAQAYLAEGADLAFIVGLLLAETADVARQVKGPLLNVNYEIPAADLEAAGLKVAIYPLLNLLASVQAVGEMMDALRRTGSVGPLRDRLAPRMRVLDLVGMESLEQDVLRYGLRPDLT